VYLQREGYMVYSALNAEVGLQLMEKHHPDIVLIDLHLPGKNGFILGQKYREFSNGILIFITGERDNRTVMKGFEIGCDDYIKKPFEPNEVIARIKAVIRRTDKKKIQKIEVDDLVINFNEKNVYKKGKKLDLFVKEKMLLFYLAEHPGQIFSSEQLFDIIWGMDSSADLKTVLVHISTLRKKIEEDPKHPKFIKTVRGFGYKFDIAK
jgi:DNA-binding response OmpR family regulator